VSTFFLFTACTVPEFNYLDKHQNNLKDITLVDKASYKKEEMFQWKISKGDRIDIQAFNQSSSSSNGQLTQLLSNGGQVYTTRNGDEGILINNDGVVRLPLIGTVTLTGLTEDQAAELLIQKYKRYLKHPYVSVKILNQKLFMLGEVKHPGVVLVTNGTMNLFEALAHSGDLTDYADRTKIKIIRGNMRNPVIREVNINDFTAMKYTSLILHPNDIIYVTPRASKATAVGYTENMPMWDLISKILSPFTSSAILYRTLN
jgi:polysaccharide export outer membrane protein